MQTIMDAASHIAEEIERTRLHLANLEQALAALRPLMTIDVSSTTLFYNQVEETQSVEDAFIVQKDKTKAKPHKAQPTQAGTAAASTPAEPEPAAVAQFAAEAAVESNVETAAESAADAVEPQQAKPASLPATGAKFWLKMVGRKAFSASELTDAALKSLSLDSHAKAVMANRARAWITAALKKGVLSAAGMRNGTHFYKLA